MIQLEEIRSFYEEQGPEDIRLREGSPQRVEFLTAARYLENYLPDKGRVLDNCAGSGIYAFHLAEQGHHVTAGDIVPYNVELMHARQAEQPVLDAIYQGDARDLSRFADKSFDMVLCMGALYHLDAPKDQRQSIDEGLRVLRDNGVLACTYINRYAVIMNNLTTNLDNLEEILSFLETGKEGVFYTSTPEEVARLLDQCGAEVLCHVALDGISTFLYHTTGLLNEDGFERWQQYHNAVCDVPSLLGYGYHNLILAKKEAKSQCLYG